MIVTSALQCLSARAAATPAKPPPMITMRGSRIIAPSCSSPFAISRILSGPSGDTARLPELDTTSVALHLSRNSRDLAIHLRVCRKAPMRLVLERQTVALVQGAQSIAPLSECGGIG